MNQASKKNNANSGNTDQARILPYPELQDLFNATGLSHFQFMKMGPGRKFFDVVIVQAAFPLISGKAQLIDEPVKPNFSDEYWNEDDATLSSLKLASDVVAYKPYCDVYVTGTIKNYGSKPSERWDGLLRVRHEQERLIDKPLCFLGPRVWEHDRKNIWRLNRSEPTNEVPLRYELAYGGHYINPKEEDPDIAIETYPSNPSGTGYFGKDYDIKKKYPGPQIELFDQAIDDSTPSYTPAGWGPIARFWSPRIERQGTYDDAWMKDFESNRYADYPKDFQMAYFNSAPADQMIPHLSCREHIELAGVFSDKLGISLELPGWKISADSFSADGKALKGWLNCDTVHIDLDMSRLTLTWRLTLKHEQKIRGALLKLVKPDGK
jgi:hypothetical protein